MGFFSELLLLPLAPVRGVVWVAQQVEQEADRRLNDPAVLRAQIDDLDSACERGEISEAERDAQQEDLLARLVGRSPAGDGDAG